MTHEKPNDTITTIVGSLRLEGLKVEPEVIADMKLINQGELTTEEALKRAFDRIKQQEQQEQ